MADLKVTYDPALDEANEIAKADIRMCMGQNRGGCLGVPPAAIGYDDGVWLADSLWAFVDGIVYWTGVEESEKYLYSETPGSMGVIPFFSRLQEKAGVNAGNIPVAWYIGRHHGHMGDYDMDYGGMFDLAYVPRKNHRDEVGPGFFFIEAMHRYWKLFADAHYMAKYYDVMRSYVDYRERGLDAKTGLFRSTYGLGDVCVDHAVPGSSALTYNNCFCYMTFERFSRMAQAIGEDADAKRYGETAQRMREAINAHLWNGKHGRYETKIFCNPTTNRKSPAYGITEDDRFHVGGNMLLLFFDVPDSLQKTATLMGEVERADGGLALYGQSVEPPYPDGWHNRIFNGGNYWNGDAWPAFAGLYAIALFRLGYPERALKVLRGEAEAAIRDGGFYEYYEDDQRGAGKGAFHYCFTAAPYQRALVEGLFGLDADYPSRRISVHPSLRHSGRISCQLGMHRFGVVVEVEGGFTRLSIETTYSGSADFRVLIEDSATICEATGGGGEALPCNTGKLGEGTYVTFESGVDVGVNSFELIYG